MTDTGKLHHNLIASLRDKYEFFRRMSFDDSEHETMVLLRTAADAIESLLTALTETEADKNAAQAREALLVGELRFYTSPFGRPTLPAVQAHLHRVFSQAARPRPETSDD